MIMILPVTRWFSCPSNSPFHHYMDFTELLHGFVEIDRWTSLNYYMDLSNLIHGKMEVLPGLVKVVRIEFSPFAKQNQAEV